MPAVQAGKAKRKARWRYLLVKTRRQLSRRLFSVSVIGASRALRGSKKDQGQGLKKHTPG